MSKCRSCGAAIIWCKTANGKAMPVDAEPVKDGNLCVTNGVAHAPTEADGFGPRFKSHFGECPHAAKHRRANK